jgi:hypothetical protein
MDSYLVGFIASDGHNRGSSWTITQTISGIDVLEKLRIRYGYSYHEVPVSEWGIQRKFTMSYSSRIHGRYLQDWGIPIGNKTYTLGFPINKPDIEIWHYMRGMFDGDGSFTIEQGIYGSVCIISHRGWCEHCVCYLEKWGITASVYDDKRHPNIASVRIRQMHSINLFFSNLYSNCYIWMDRKYRKWIEFSIKRGYIMDRKIYEDELRKRQEDHLRNVMTFGNAIWFPCMHDSCPECHGTGIKIDGSMCIHNISCPCPRCTPYC